MSTFDKLNQILYVVRLPIVIIGLIGNILSFIVFSRKAFRNNSINIYCRALAISDSFIILHTFINDIGRVFLNRNFENETSVYCKIFNFITIGLSPISGWILVVFSFDKMICVARHNSFFEYLLKKRNFQLSVIVSIVFLHLLLYGVVLFKMDIQTISKLAHESFENSTNSTQWVNVTVCVTNSDEFSLIINSFYLIESSLVPFVLMLFTTIVTIMVLVKSRKNLEHNQTKMIGKARRMREAKFAINAIVLNMLFILLTLPFVLSNFIVIEDKPCEIFVFLLLLLVFHLNFCLSFFIYIFSNSIFRVEFRKLMRPFNKLASTSVENMNFNENNLGEADFPKTIQASTTT